jgi:sigma-B regulation protein RsbU (phosphoserine phosphatase)
MRVLVAEDDTQLGSVLAEMLRQQAFEVTLVHDGAEAWQALLEEHYPIVLTDWSMPRLSGLELTRKLRAAAGQDYTYIIVLTGRLDRGSFRQGMAAGADDFLTKPCSSEEIAARLTVARRIMSLQSDLAEANRVLRRSNNELQFFKQRVQHELEAAARVQESLLPAHVPSLPGLSLHWKLEPTAELAGDVLNVFMLNDHSLGVYVLDVSGHGVSAALLSAQLSRLLSPVPTQSQLLVRTSNGGDVNELAAPVDVLTELNRLFPMNPNVRQFFTLVYGVVDLESGSFRFSSAGHPGPIVARRSGEVGAIDVPGTPIGLMADGSWSEREVRLEAGDLLVLYSDGVVEAMDAEGHMFGSSRLAAVVRDRADPRVGLPAFCDGVLGDVDAWSSGWPHHDDRTLLALRLEG